MARMTRSKKVNITEDDSAQTLESFFTGPQLHPLSGNIMSATDDLVELEVRGLKAAYREAIGMPQKIKKSRNKKNLQDDKAPESEASGAPAMQPSVVRTTRRQAKALEAEEALRKVSSQKGQDYSEILASEVSLEAEPKVLNESFADKVFIMNPSKQTTALVENVKDRGEQSTLNPSTLAIDQDGDQDSFVEQITSRSPAKAFTGPRDHLELRLGQAIQGLSKPYSSSPNRSSVINEDDQDSFVEHISNRSPAKPRIEDTVEALDQMEEVEEALHEAAMAESLVSPEKKRQKNEQPVKLSFQSMRVKLAPKRASIIKKATSMTFRPSEPDNPDKIDLQKPRVGLDTSTSHLPPTNLTKHRKPVPRPTSLLPSKDSSRTAKPVTRPTNYELPGEAVARKLKEQRERRKAQRESSEDSFHTARPFSGPSVKSTKPLTKPTFELPGEAVSRKKRELHDAKVKAQEEEERKRREFKAKPVRQSTVSSVRDTAASRARHSRVGPEGITDGLPGISKRSSMNIGAHRPSMVELATMAANTSAPRSPGPINKTAPMGRKSSTKFHGPSMSGLAMQRTVSASEVQVQRQKAKEIYNRDQKLAEDIGREKREREAAAKRSREEAAERGRQASREWAEKQKAKKLAEGDKGLSAGYGPGGQMGLKA